MQKFVNRHHVSSRGSALQGSRAVRVTASDPAGALRRMVSFFPTEEQERIRIQIVSNLTGVVALAGLEPQKGCDPVPAAGSYLWTAASARASSRIRSLSISILDLRLTLQRRNRLPRRSSSYRSTTGSPSRQRKSIGGVWPPRTTISLQTPSPSKPRSVSQGQPTSAM